VRLGRRLDGPDDGPLVVLSGALGTTTSMWRAQLPSLASGYLVLRHDLPGHGDSPLPDRPVTVAAVGAAIVALLDELDVGSASFCGISFGGMVGLWLGAYAPERIERLVVACTGASLGTPALYAERAAAVRANGTEIVVDGARERWFTPAFRDSDDARRILAELRSVPREGYAACAEAVGSFDFHRELAKVSVPTLVVHGDEDPVTPPDVVDELAGGIPGARRVSIAHAAHLANVEQPAAFSSAVLSHLGERAAA
jgi:3-oxoadipate enol-lactonase